LVGAEKRSDQGTPQGGLVSPVLANIYLHYTLDIWFVRIPGHESQGFQGNVDGISS
jgi:hypothetical protein